MTTLERMGLTWEDFKALYDVHDGFDTPYNKNHPISNTDDSNFSFIKQGAESLVAESLSEGMWV